MGRNASSDKEQEELEELIARYEAAKKENKQLYLDGDQLADIADRYAVDRRFNEAQEAINYGLKLHPAHTDLLIQQAYLYLDMMEYQKAKNVVQSITETYHTEVKILKAEIFLNEGKLDEAEKLLNSIEDKESLNTILDVSYLYMDMGYTEKAFPWLSTGLEVYMEEEDFLAAFADFYRNSEHHDKAIYFYNKLIDKNPYDPSYWTGLAKCHYDQEEYDKALEACDFALAVDENSGEAHTTKAHCLFHLENETEAIREYQLALQNKNLAPEFAHMFIGLAYANLEKWELSYKSYEDALNYIESDNSPILSDVYSNMVYCLFRLGRYEQAHLICKKAMEKFPGNVEFYLQEGRIYLAEEKFEDAQENWALALQYAPEADTLIQIGSYNLSHGLVENALFYYEEAQKMDPNHLGINGLLASICMFLKDHRGFNKYNHLSEYPINSEALKGLFAESMDENIRKQIEEFLQESERYKNESMKERDQFHEDDNIEDKDDNVNDYNNAK